MTKPTTVAGKLYLSCYHDALPGPRLSYPLQPNIYSTVTDGNLVKIEMNVTIRR